ncbi:hypothetical protein AB0B92_34315 [Streptomyces hygroscopicus]|uniref:hypothetical protein n=1 Tax=Streptomyces hygroscopicus TaxID=1912 RepID=UPI0033C942DE
MVNISRRAVRSGFVLAATIGIIAVPVYGAAASEGGDKEPDVTPRIVDPITYEKNGGIDPLSIQGDGSVQPAGGTDVDSLSEMLRSVTGLRLQSAPVTENYGDLGALLSFVLVHEDEMHSVNVTRQTMKGDVPTSLLSDSADVTQLETLPNGTQVYTASGAGGITVTTLSSTGQLTRWEVPIVTEDGTSTTLPAPWDVAEVERWAITVDQRSPEKVASKPAATLSAPAARPKCQLIMTKPVRHGGNRIAADASMSCNQKGKGNFAAAIRQYHGLGVWKTKDTRGYTNVQGDTFPLLPHFNCTPTVSTWQYRSWNLNASLRNRNGYWGHTGDQSASAYINCG